MSMHRQLHRLPTHPILHLLKHPIPARRSMHFHIPTAISIEVEPIWGGEGIYGCGAVFERFAAGEVFGLGTVLDS